MSRRHQLRILSEIDVDFAIWGDDDGVPADGWAVHLGLPDDLAERVLNWHRSVQALGHLPPADSYDRMVAADVVGWELSRELQAFLGESYTVHYGALTEEGRRLRRQAKVEGS